jgi:hypothetical protein
MSVLTEAVNTEEFQVDPQQQSEGTVSWKVFLLFVAFGIGNYLQTSVNVSANF